MKGPSVKQSMKHKVCSKLADLPPWEDLPLDLNGNFKFELFELIWADQLADLTPPGRSATSASEWIFHISTVRADIGIS